MLIAMIAAALFLFGGIVGVLATLAIGIHSHSRAKRLASTSHANIYAARRILGVGPLDETDHSKQRGS